jgi:hypothetical protein
LILAHIWDAFGYLFQTGCDNDATEDATAEDGDVLGSMDTAAFRTIIVHQYSARSCNNQRSFNAIIYSRLSSSSTIDEHVSSWMEVAAIIW